MRWGRADPATSQRSDPNTDGNDGSRRAQRHSLPATKQLREAGKDETFRRVSADDEDRVDYRAHYNARLNKCLYAETYISPTPAGINMWVYLSDLRENRIYGGFHRSTNIGLFYCNLEDKECHSEAEWNEIVKQYMEE